MIKLDSFYTIGKTHTVCEDYVIHENNPVPHIILADGCSSSPNTDLGARILTHITKHMIKTFKPRGLQHFIPEGIVFYISNMVQRITTDLGLIDQNLDSTLIILCKDLDSNKVRLLLSGDGIIIVKNKEVALPHIVQVSYLNEMPYYLSYAWNKERNNRYNEKAKQLEPKGLIKTIKTMTEAEKVPYYDLTSIEYDLIDIEYIMVSSDGLDSFYDKNSGEKIPIEMVVTHLSQFKSFKGEFLKRRIKRMLKNYEKLGIFHYDDLSLGIMYNC